VKNSRISKVQVKAETEVASSNKEKKKETGTVPKRRIPLRETPGKAEDPRSQQKTTISASSKSAFEQKKAELGKIRESLGKQLAKGKELEYNSFASNVLKTYFDAVSLKKGSDDMLRLDDNFISYSHCQREHRQVSDNTF